MMENKNAFIRGAVECPDTIWGRSVIKEINKIIIQNNNKQSRVISDIYEKSIWNKYDRVLSHVVSKPDNYKKIIPQYLAFVNETKAFFNTSNIFKVKIFLSNKEIFNSYNYSNWL